MSYRLLTTAILIAVVVAANAQAPITIDVQPTQLPDSADIEYYGKKHFGEAAAMVVGLNTTVWAFDRFVRKADYSYISFKTIAENFKEGFKWDNDALETNMFMHPYHGNLYFNSGRANGYNFWQSSLFAFAGSAMWEMCMENEYPSTNDIIATPIGGTALGEVAYRTSDIILNDNTTGWERAGREAAAFIVSPMRGLTRLINGDMWRHRSTTGRQFGIPKMAFEVSVGARMLGFKNQVAEHGFGVSTELNLEYGDRFELRSNRPYDFFSVRVNLNAQRSQPVLSQLNVLGRLISREIIDTQHHDMSVGIYQHYDFYDSDTLSVRTAKIPYRLGIPASLGSGVLYRYTDAGRIVFDAGVYTNAILLGGLLSDHYDVDERDYNLASGFSIKTGVNVIFGKDALSLAAGYKYFRLFTWGYPRYTDLSHANPRTLNALGDESVAYFGVARVRFDLRLAQRLYLTGTYNHYLRSTRYRDFDNVRSASFVLRLMLSYKF